MRFLKSVALTGVVMASMMSVASAVPITETLSYSSATSWGTGGVPATAGATTFTPNHILNSSGFNLALGTLTSVVVSFAENTTGSFSVTNNGTSAANLTANLQNRLKVIVPGLVQQLLITNTAEVEISGLAPTATYSSETFSAGSTLGPFTLTAPATLALYSTAWSATLGDLGRVVLAGPGNLDASFLGIGEGVINVTYNYTPSENVPEPMTVVLLGTAVAGLAAARRRKR